MAALGSTLFILGVRANKSGLGPCQYQRCWPLALAKAPKGVSQHLNQQWPINNRVYLCRKVNEHVLTFYLILEKKFSDEVKKPIG